MPTVPIVSALLLLDSPRSQKPERYSERLLMLAASIRLDSEGGELNNSTGISSDEKEGEKDALSMGEGGERDISASNTDGGRGLPFLSGV